MIKLRSRNRKIHPFVFVGLLVCVVFACGAGEAVKKAAEAETEQLLGQKLGRKLNVKWNAEVPGKNDWPVYRSTAPSYDRELFVTLARHLGVRGEPQPLPSSNLYAPGFWIKETSATNSASWKSLLFSEISGTIRYSNGEDNHRWDLKNKRPLVIGVPNEAEALSKTLALLPALGLKTTDFECLPDGKIKYRSDDEGTWYNDQHDGGKRKRYVRQINIELRQRVADGAFVLPIGSGGTLRAGFMSEGKLAQLEITFRKLEPVSTVVGQSARELERIVSSGEARTFRGYVPSELTITDCRVVYPQANAMTRQTFIRPAYVLDAKYTNDGETNTVYLYAPISW